MAADGHLTLVDAATASTLSQVLPLLLLTLTVEMRRHELHLAFPRVRLTMFFLVFGLIETVLVLSIDGSVYPFQWFDACSALIIFGVMVILLRLSLSEPGVADDVV
ncbi:MAG: hypothetical protein ACKOQ4_01350 [Mycobacterium sp.]